jgi:hypothetical protein
MTRDQLASMLADLTGSVGAGGSFVLQPQDEVSLLLALDGALVPIDRLVRVDLRQDHVRIESGRAEVYLLEPSRIVGFKRKQADRDVAGFLPA